MRAAENGQVIYAGSGVEGYGNLILIRHPSSYVSTAHLKDDERCREAHRGQPGDTIWLRPARPVR